MTKKRLATPGMSDIEQGVIRVTRIELVINKSEFKVWEVTTKAKRADISHVHGNEHEIWLTDYDYTMYTDEKRASKTTKLYLDLNPQCYWNILVNGAKNDYTIVAYTTHDNWKN